MSFRYLPCDSKNVWANGFSIVREYVGRGVGKDLHGDPDIPHYGTLTTVRYKSLNIIGPKRSFSAK
jgi:methionine aminopeptidase